MHDATETNNTQETQRGDQAQGTKEEAEAGVKIIPSISISRLLFLLLLLLFPVPVRPFQCPNPQTKEKQRQGSNMPSATLTESDVTIPSTGGVSVAAKISNLKVSS